MTSLVQRPPCNPRTRAVVLCALALVFGVALLPLAAQDVYGPWQVRRGRTTDCKVAGGYPKWNVTFSGDRESPTVVIDGDTTGDVRGTVLIGRLVPGATDSLPGLRFAYATRCSDPNRCGRVELVVVDPDAWRGMSVDRLTEEVFDNRDSKACYARLAVRDHVGDDVEEPVELREEDVAGLAAAMRRYAGRDVVLALAWTGLHGSDESAEFRGVRLVQVDPGDALRGLFGRLDLNRPDLAGVKAAVEADRMDEAVALLAAHFRERRLPAMPGDPRTVEQPTISAGRLAEADGALENRFIGQSKYGLQKVPDGIDWAFNPTKDPEWTWQFNRHSAWLALGDAYRATGEERYAVKWVALMHDWVAENPAGTRWSWRTLEAGIRGLLWPRVFLAFVDAPPFTAGDQALFLSSLADHADYLLPAKRFHSGSNWGQTESLGLLNIASFCPELRDAETWRDTAWKRLEAEMFRQVHEDGAQVELTTSYHQGTIGGFVRAAEIAKLGGTEPTSAYWQRLERMYEYTMILQKPDGTQPMLGDFWPGNTSGTLRDGAARFGREDMLYVATNGREGEQPDFLDAALPEAGYYVMRTGWVEDRAVYAMVDVAHHWGGGHQQPDALQINLYAYGKTLLPDSGSYLYYGPERKAFARTSSHSTVTVDGEDQNTSPARLHAFFSSGLFSLVDGEHSGYEGVTHRRQVLFVRPREEAPAYLVVVDRLTGEGSHRVDLHYHFLPGPFECVPGALRARSLLPQGPNLLVGALPRRGLTMSEIASWVSYVYTKKEPRPAVRLRWDGALPATFVTLLVPYAGRGPPPLDYRELTVAGAGEPVAVEVSGSGFRDAVFVCNRPGRTTGEGLDVDGLAGMFRHTADGKPVASVSVSQPGISPELTRRWGGRE